MAAGTTAVALPQSGGMAEWIGKKIKTAADEAKAKREELQKDAAEKGEEYQGKPGSLFSQGLSYQFAGKYRDRFSSTGEKNPLALKKSTKRKPKSSSTTSGSTTPKQPKPKTFSGSLGAIVQNTSSLIGIASTQNKILSVNSQTLSDSNQLLRGLVTINQSLLNVSNSILEANRDQLNAQEYASAEKSLEGKQDAADLLKVKSPYDEEDEEGGKGGKGGGGLGAFASKIFARGLSRAPGRLGLKLLGRKGYRTAQGIGKGIGKIGGKFFSPLAKAGKGIVSKLAPKGITAGISKLAPKVGSKIGGAAAKGVGKSLVKKIPLLGAVAGIGFGIQRAMQGDWLGAAGELASGVASTVPGIGTAVSLGIDGALLGRDLAGGGQPQSPPQMAEGGIVDNPTTFRAGEAGPELVMPLSKLMDTGLSAAMPGYGLMKSVSTGFGSVGEKEDPMQSAMSLPMKAIGGSILAVAGQFIKALGPVGSAIAPVVGALIGPLEKTFGVPGSLVKFDIGGSIKGSGSASETKKQSIEFLKKLITVLVPGGGLIAGLLSGGKKQEETTNDTPSNTRGSVPGGQKQIKQLVEIAKGAGFSGNNAAVAASVAMAESGGNPNAHNKKYPDNSYGLWQINMLDEPGYMLGAERRKKFNLKSNDELFDPATNAEVALKLSGGSNFSAWSTYENGLHRPYMKDAQAALTAKPQMAQGGIAVSSRRGWRELQGKRDYHEGTDISAPTGTNLFAFDDGKVDDLRVDGKGDASYGNSVYWIDSKGYGHLYAHLSSFGKGVKKGLSFKKGKILGAVGSTGRSTGPHLHWEMAANPRDVGMPKGSGNRIDPLSRYNYMTPFTGKPKPGDGLDASPSSNGSDPSSPSSGEKPASALASLPPDATPEQRMEAAKTDFMNLATPALSSVSAVAKSLDPASTPMDTAGTETAAKAAEKPTGPAGGPLGIPSLPTLPGLLPNPIQLAKMARNLVAPKPKKVSSLPKDYKAEENKLAAKARASQIGTSREGSAGGPSVGGGNAGSYVPPKPKPQTKPAKPAAPQSGTAAKPVEEKMATDAKSQPSVIQTTLPPIEADERNPKYGGSAKNLEPWALSTHQIFALN